MLQSFRLVAAKLQISFETTAVLKENFLKRTRIQEP